MFKRRSAAEKAIDFALDQFSSAMVDIGFYYYAAIYPTLGSDFDSVGEIAIAFERVSDYAGIVWKSGGSQEIRAGLDIGEVALRQQYARMGKIPRRSPVTLDEAVAMYRQEAEEALSEFLLAR